MLGSINEVMLSLHADYEPDSEHLYSIEAKNSSSSQNSNKEKSIYSPFEMTPITIDEVPATAMVDTGANPSFISLKFCQDNGITILPDTVTTQISRTGLTEPKSGTSKVSVLNGTENYHNL
jgi:hypothetical protein